MGRLHQKVIRALKSHLQDLQDALEDLPSGRVSGVVISPTFTSMNYPSRQGKLKTILSRELTADEFSAVGAIAALTPAEANVKAI